jgi:hypothetical protein
MPLTNTGRNLIAARLVGATMPAIDATTGYLGVGDSATAFVNTQTDLVAAANKFRKILDGAPVLATNLFTCISTFASGDANFAWNEFGLFNAAAAGTMFSRKVSAQGTKTIGQVWELTYAQTVVNGD